MSSLLQEDRLIMEEIPVEGYEKVYKVEEAGSGLKAIICLHNLTLGPALGGTRIYPYSTFEEALNDVKRLSKGMTYKSVLAGACLGGGKSVIIADPASQKSPELLMAFARAVDRLEGVYICAEDVGCTPEDLAIIASTTRYVSGLMHEKSSGNPSYYTAFGVYRGIQACLKKVYGSDSVKGRTIAIQGLGSVGSVLAGLLFWNGANLIVSDVNEEKARKVASQYGATYVNAKEILFAKCDVLAPCALGGILNEESIPLLQTRIVAGAANNQLLLDKDADRLLERDILYAPDFVINAGGLINVTEEISVQGYDPVVSRNKVDALYEQLLAIFNLAEEKEISTHQAATELGDYRLKHKIGLRTEAPCFHHSL
jgi:leucine dehydrogenase